MQPQHERWGGRRRAATPLCLGLLLAVLLAACGTPAQEAKPELTAVREAATPTPSPTPSPSEEPSPEPVRVLEPRGEPQRIVIPSIDVDAELLPVGLADDGTMETPDFGLAGWYEPGPRPGAPGPAVVVAHVDSRAGPDVFYRLRELTPGAEARVVYDSGDTAHFVIGEVQQTDKDELPADLIWPVTSDRLLTLITCGGEFDRSVRHYVDNVIAYAQPADPVITRPGRRRAG